MFKNNYIHTKLQFILISFYFCYVSCSNAQIMDYGNVGFDLDNPVNQITNLPDILKEVSGLSYFKENQIICLNDESANTYVIDTQTGNIVEKFEVALIGDFEDVVYLENNIYTLKSNGTIYEYTASNKVKIEPLKFPTELNDKNNAEGLAFDQQSNTLLIACKGEPSLKGSGNTLSGCRSIYQFDLGSKKLRPDPFLIIKLDDLKKRFGFENFMPSAIAEHPKTGNFYILSSVGKTMLVVDRKNRIVAAKKLKHSLFKQPEGICFDTNGEFLYISNEGKKGKADILIFKSQ